jgi:hypothetical protein
LPAVDRGIELSDAHAGPKDRVRKQGLPEHAESPPYSGAQTGEGLRRAAVCGKLAAASVSRLLKFDL